MIDLIIKTNGSERHLSLPIDEQFVPGITEKNSVTTVMVVNEPESLRYLVGKQWSVDELNFLAKRLESFDKLEDAQFNAAVSYLQPQSIKDLINLTFNLPRYSIIRNVFNLAEVGRTYIITRQQAMSLEEIEQTDFAKIGREVLTSGKGIPTEYGLLFINEDIPEEQVYDGKHFPEYAYKDSLLCVSVSCKGETEYLHMPCSVADINNALSKLPVESWSDCKLSIEWDNLRESSWLAKCDKILQSEDAYCLNKVQMVLAGKVNKSLVARIENKGGNAIGLSGMDGRMIEARVKDARLGFVGEITKVNVAPILDVIDKGYIPVVSTVGCDREGNVYNINADTAAAKIAGELRAESLISVTDIAGILRDRNDPATLIPVIRTADAPGLIADGTISGGMIPKVECCINAIRWGVNRVFIIDGRIPHAILIEMLTNEGIGTMFTEGLPTLRSEGGL